MTGSRPASSEPASGEPASGGPASWRLVTAPYEEVPTALRRQVHALTAAAWPGSAAGPAHDPDLRPVSMLLVGPGEEVGASLDLLTVPVVHRGRSYRVTGLSAVTTRPDLRRRGLGGRLARAAHDLLAGADERLPPFTRAADLALFTCDPPLVGLYSGAGWRELPGTSLLGGTREDPLDSAALGKRTLGDFFSAHARAHASDFVGTVVELYPGAIDRLF